MDAIRAAYDAGTFRENGHRLVDLLADYLARATAGGGMPVLPWKEPDACLAAWPAAFPEDPDPSPGALADLVARVVDGSTHLHHPRFVGHQVTAPLPAAALAEFAAALLNNSMAVYEMGPVSTAMERAVVGWMAERIGFSGAAGGVLTSGGSAGNLTALLAARQARAGFDAWTDGTSGGTPLAVLASGQTHYCVQRAVQIMGWGAGGAVAVPVDGRYRMRADALERALDDATGAGRRVIAVVASAASTSTGAYDPLEPIADFCERHGLWLHVDGAHGAAAALSPEYRHFVAGIERADSVVWDAHKMMLMPALVTAVLFRDGSRSYEAFAQQAAYLFSESDPAEEWYNLATRTLECTKRMMSLKLYLALSVSGTRMFGDYVTAMYGLARRFAARIAASPDFELAVEPESNIVCFRWVGDGSGLPEDLDALQDAIRRRVVAGGGYYLVRTALPDGVYLRVTIINPSTTDGDLEALPDAVRAAARAELAALQPIGLERHRGD